MGYGDRARQRGFGNGNGAIVSPNGPDRTVHINDLSKAQLATALNEQTQRFTTLRSQLQVAARVLLAIALEPEALKFADGKVTVDSAAIERVKNGMEIGIDSTASGAVELKVVRREAAVIDTPTILVPRG